MSLLDLFVYNGPGPFIKEDEYYNNLSVQVLVVPAVLSLLNDIEEEADQPSCLEFFFYTNTKEKAEDLIMELKLLGYQSSYGKFLYAENQYTITGCTANMKMSSKNLVKWVQFMCDLGFKHDCRFDGWGTSID